VISREQLFSSFCPQPEYSLSDTGTAVHYRALFQSGILRDKLQNGLLSLRRSCRVSDTNEPLYYVIFASATPGHSWVSEETDYDTAFSTYSAVIYEEYI
jgi:hypothetical protein